MLENNANNTAAQDTHTRHSPIPQRWMWFVIAALALISLDALAFWCRDSIAMILEYNGTDEMSRGAQFFRDVVVLSVAIVGIVVAAWRNYSLDKQAEAANEQAKTAANQFGLAEKRLLSDQFANASEWMVQKTDKNEPSISARVNGIYTMSDLAMIQPKEFAKKAVISLVAYIKEHIQSATDEKLLAGAPVPYSEARSLREDVKIAFEILHNIFSDNKTKDIAGKIVVDFSGYNFSRLNLRDIKLQHYKKWARANFCRSILANADFRGADLCQAIISEANLSSADLRGADFSGANMAGAFLGGANGQWANFSYADWLSINAYNMKFGETNMRGTKNVLISGDATHVLILGDLKKAMQGKIWYNDDDEWAQGIDRIGSDFKWDLTKYKDGHILAGIMRNFPISLTPHESAIFWMQARKMLDDGHLPKNFPEERKEWLKTIDPKTGMFRTQNEES